LSFDSDITVFHFGTFLSIWVFELLIYLLLSVSSHCCFTETTWCWICVPVA